MLVERSFSCYEIYHPVRFTQENTMQAFDINEFHDRFEELVEMAAKGEAFEVHQNGQPVVVVTAIDSETDL
jgi:hypothetical protein